MSKEQLPDMNGEDALERELKQLIVEVGNLEDIKAEDIDSEAPLFNEGLGLDSIDALELGMAVVMKYGIQLGQNQDENTKYFRSVRSLAELIRTKMAASKKTS